MHFGFPFYNANEPDPTYFQYRNSKYTYTPPAQELGPHVAALGMIFYNGHMFPKEYQNQIFIAEHGSWNRILKIGYRITLVNLQKNKSVIYQPFITGWLQGQRSWGRPVDLLVMPDGAILISDDQGGAIYRVSYSGGTT